MLWKLNHFLRIVHLSSEFVLVCWKEAWKQIYSRGCHNACIAERYIEAIFCAQSIFVLIGTFFCSTKLQLQLWWAHYSNMVPKPDWVFLETVATFPHSIQHRLFGIATFCRTTALWEFQARNSHFFLLPLPVDSVIWVRNERLHIIKCAWKNFSQDTNCNERGLLLSVGYVVALSLSSQRAVKSSQFLASIDVTDMIHISYPT